MKKVLPTSYPVIHGWSHYAHLLLMLQGNEATYDYIFSNLVQLYFGYERNEVRCDFYFPYPFSVSLFDKCSCLLVNRIRKSKVCDSKENLKKFIIDELENNFYIHIFMDHKYIKAFNTNNHPHDCLIYGIDDEVLYVADVFQKGIYSQKEIPIDEALESILKCNLSKDEDYMLGCIEIYKMHDNLQYSFDINNFNNQIACYFNSTVPEYWNLYENKKKDEYKFGISTYDGVIEYLSKIAESKLEIDIRILYVVKDHKTIMIDRLSFIEKKNILNSRIIYEMKEIYKELESQMDGLIFYALIYNKKKSLKISEDLIIKIRNIYQKEKIILSKYISEIIK